MKPELRYPHSLVIPQIMLSGVMVKFEDLNGGRNQSITVDRQQLATDG
jgi:hypothetical protein